MENNRNFRYRINNVVDFLPEQNKLISCETKREYSMYGTASRCLDLFITHSDNIVTHKLLYEAGWENQGKDVTPNTLYQTISELRKQLNKAGIKQNIIQTYPRRGWGIFEGTEIKKIQISPQEKNEFPITPAEPHPFIKLYRRLSQFFLKN
ncbi:winged helix-turn-helix domain-containing protein [Erwinia sp. E_sp_B04_7]|uniref:winged helix-turn-helix domain-containing protein n=1 Tax=unclassified Erwinia TaxID=2622719 RepID=UPI0030D2DE36